MVVKKSSFPNTVTIQPIGVIHSCFTEKFGIPRQPGMVPAAIARMELLPPCNREEMVRGLQQFSHIWVHFLFHQTVSEGWKPTVRPPWLGGQKRVGVFASRSPHRPNHMGLSVVKLEAIVKEKDTLFLDLSGIDFLDQTPVLDIKPYIPYSDCLESACCGYAKGLQPEVLVTFTAEALAFCSSYQGETGRNIVQLIKEMIRHDPRPASQKKNKSRFGMLLWDVNIRWCVEAEGFRVEECAKVQVNGVHSHTGNSSRKTSK
ncbi:MAG: tRNA (N6-threonylcarbamoyladenosine(37)-N6)-methyltransferase TrmO [Proteobacteria bacterium]|nr:tRNA (N6-threonylcarbamoyladenosine(37)-N6)-methyltransferase TrmO [Pseudomonadota bacterium]